MIAPIPPRAPRRDVASPYAPTSCSALFEPFPAAAGLPAGPPEPGRLPDASSSVSGLSFASSSEALLPVARAGHPPGTDPAQERTSTLRRLAALGLTTLSLVTGSLLGTPAAASLPPSTAGLAAPSISMPLGTEVPAPTIGAETKSLSTAADAACPVPSRDADATTVRAWKDQIAQRMLARGARGKAVDPGVARKVRQELEVLPPDVLALLDRNGTGIVVLKPGQTPIEAGVIEPVRIAEAFRDTAELRRIVDEEAKAGDARYGLRIRVAQSDLAALPQARWPWDHARRASLESRLAELEQARNERFYERVTERANGLVEPHTVVIPGDTSGLGIPLGSILANAPLSLAQAAEMHGAKTPEEIETFVGLVRALNGERLDQAQARYAAAHPDEAVPPDPIHRPFHALRDLVVMPGLYYLRDAAHPEAPPVVLSAHDAMSLQIWQSRDVHGQYWYQGKKNTVVLWEERLGHPLDDRSVLIHELGHALEDAAHERDPAFYGDTWLDARNDHYRRILSQDAPLPSEYARSGADEMAAEAFAYTFPGNARRLKQTDAAWKEEFDRFVERERQVGASCPRGG